MAENGDHSIIPLGNPKFAALSLLEIEPTGTEAGITHSGHLEQGLAEPVASAMVGVDEGRTPDDRATA